MKNSSWWPAALSTVVALLCVGFVAFGRAPTVRAKTGTFDLTRLRELVHLLTDDEATERFAEDFESGADRRQACLALLRELVEAGGSELEAWALRTMIDRRGTERHFAQLLLAQLGPLPDPVARQLLESDDRELRALAQISGAIAARRCDMPAADAIPGSKLTRTQFAAVCDDPELRQRIDGSFRLSRQWHVDLDRDARPEFIQQIDRLGNGNGGAADFLVHGAEQFAGLREAAVVTASGYRARPMLIDDEPYGPMLFAASGDFRCLPGSTARMMHGVLGAEYRLMEWRGGDFEQVGVVYTCPTLDP